MSYAAAVSRLKQLGRMESSGNHVAFDLLSKQELQVLQIAITNGLRKNKGLSSASPLPIDVTHYAEAFDVTEKKAAIEIAAALAELYERSFAFVSNEGHFVKSRFIASMSTVKGEPIFELTLASTVVEKLMNDLNALNERMTNKADLLVDLSVDTGIKASTMDKHLKSDLAGQMYWFFIERLSLGQSKFEIHFERFIDMLDVYGDYPTAYDLKSQMLDAALYEIKNLTDISVSCTITPKVRADRFLFKIKESGWKKISTNK